MIYGRLASGEKTLRFTEAEVKALEAGKPVVKHAADSKGHFKITVKMTRLRTKAARFQGL